MSDESRKKLIPSKTFLFGEYGVLFGGPCFVLAHSPFFETLSVSKNKESQDSDLDKVKVHKLSPAGKILLENNLENSLSLKDPHNFKGGFGRSTAEFVAALEETQKSFSTKEAYDKYMSFFKEDKVKPSGADLIVQLEKRSAYFTKNPFSYEVFDWPFKEVLLLLCHTNNKVETHDHLNKELQDLDFKDLIEISRKALKNLLEKDLKAFVLSLGHFSTEQERLGLLHENTAHVVRELNKREEVLISRGCGALGADVVAILINRTQFSESLSSCLKELNLDLICEI